MGAPTLPEFSKTRTGLHSFIRVNIELFFGSVPDGEAGESEKDPSVGSSAIAGRGSLGTETDSVVLVAIGVVVRFKIG